MKVTFEVDHGHTWICYINIIGRLNIVPML
jgi:hypothetical protein